MTFTQFIVAFFLQCAFFVLIVYCIYLVRRRKRVDIEERRPIRRWQIWIGREFGMPNMEIIEARKLLFTSDHVIFTNTDHTEPIRMIPLKEFITLDMMNPNKPLGSVEIKNLHREVW